MKKASPIKKMADCLIAVSLLGFCFTFYPILRAYFPQEYKSATELQRKGGIFIVIPKIRAESTVITNVDPWNEESYKAALKKGVAQAKGTSLPGEKGTIFLFAHSSGNPWEISHTNTIFLRLGELQKGDNIYLVRNNNIYTYKTYGKKEVWPNETHYLMKNKENALILQTCTPVGTSLKRLLIFAKQV